MSFPESIDQYINKKTTRFVVISQLLMMAWTFASSMFHGGWVSASVIVWASVATYVIYAIVSKNVVFQKLVIFGFAVGFLELIADHYSVSTLNALKYPADEPKLWVSPIYMAPSWMVAIVQLGWYSVLLIRWKGVAIATIAMTLLGGSYIPSYEWMAKNAEWWHYENVSMIFKVVPDYIIGCELLLSLFIPVLIYQALKRQWYWSILLGAIEGLWIWPAAAIAYAITG